MGRKSRAGTFTRDPGCHDPSHGRGLRAGCDRVVSACSGLSRRLLSDYFARTSNGSSRSVVTLLAEGSTSTSIGAGNPRQDVNEGLPGQRNPAPRVRAAGNPEMYRGRSLRTNCSSGSHLEQNAALPPFPERRMSEIPPVGTPKPIAPIALGLCLDCTFYWLRN